MQKFPPPLVSFKDVEVKATADLDAIIKRNEWGINVFDLTPDDCLLLCERLYAELGYIKVTERDTTMHPIARGGSG
jgi:hypothetical protein